MINTGTTIVTFLMVFLIQNSQNRDAAAMQAKLDELLRAVGKARGAFIGIEHLTDAEIEKIRDALERETGSAQRRARRARTPAPPTTASTGCSPGSERRSRAAGAGEGNRTLVVSLGSFCSAIELHPRGRLI